MSEREAFEQWIKKEHPHIYSGSLKDNYDSVRFKMDVDFMFSAWQASAQRQDYKLVPVEPTQNMIDKAVNDTPETPSQDYWHDSQPISDDQAISCYKAMIGEETK